MKTVMYHIIPTIPKNMKNNFFQYKYRYQCSHPILDFIAFL